MSKHLWLRLPVLIVSGCLAAEGCGDDQDPEGARQLWDQIHALEYRHWQRAPGYEARRDSRAPHSHAVDIFVNDVVRSAIESDQALDRWPLGSLIVKDGWDRSELELVAVMQKREAGWYWAEFDAAGDASYSGAPRLCIDCHASGADAVRAFDLPRSH